MKYPAWIVEEGVWPIEAQSLDDIDVIMATRFAAGLKNPRLRELVEQDLAEVAYELRKLTQPGTRAYYACTNVIGGHLGIDSYAVLVELDARSGRNLLAEATGRLTGSVSTRAPRQPSSLPDKC